MAQDVQGIQGRGQAGVFGGSVSPLQVYLQQGANRQRREQQLYEEDRKKRDDLIGDLRKFNPDKVWEPFYDEVNQFVQKNVRDYAYKGLEKGVPVSRLNADLERNKGEANTLVNKINWLKSQHTDIGARIDKDQYLDPNYYHPKLNDMFFNGRNAKPMNEIDTNNAENIFNDSKGYNVPKITEDFLKGVPQKINEHYTKLMNDLGENYDIEKTGTKLGIQRNPDGSIVMDPRTNQPKIQMTDDVYRFALQNKYVSNILKDNLSPTASDVQKKDYLTKIMAGADPTMIENRPMVGHKLDKEDKWSSYNGINFSGQVNPRNVYDRFHATESIWNGRNPGYLQHFFQPLENTTAFYSDKDGNKVQDPAKATHIRLEYPDKGKVKINSMIQEMIMYDDKIPADKKKDEIQKLEGYLARKDFNLNSKDDRVAFHLLSNRLQDTFDTKNNAYGDDYRRVVEKELGYNDQKGPIPQGRVR